MGARGFILPKERISPGVRSVEWVLARAWALGRLRDDPRVSCLKAPVLPSEKDQKSTCRVSAFPRSTLQS